LVAKRHEDAVGFIPPAGESLGQTHARVLRFLEGVAAEHPRDTVLIVTHGGPLRMVVAGLLGMPLAAAFRLRMDNCGLTVCESFPRSPTVATVNDTCHLRGLASADPALGN
jgi:alpha-ribazole phosphatase